MHSVKTVLFVKIQKTQFQFHLLKNTFTFYRTSSDTAGCQNAPIFKYSLSEMMKGWISNVIFVFFFIPDAMWTAKYHVWHGSIAPPFYLQEVRSGPWTLVSSWWKTQQSQSTASRSKMLTSMTKGPMSAQSSQTRNQNRQKCISLFKVRPVSDSIQLQHITRCAK